MALDYNMKTIARVECDLPDKFALPRQSGRVRELTGRIVFEEGYRDANALRGLAEYSHIWIVWVFDRAQRDGWSPTVRPPRLGGNERVGVFATRSPFRPNPIALSCVELSGIEHTRDRGDVLVVKGIDMADGTPVLDIKPYIPYTDSRPEALGSFAEREKEHALAADESDPLLERLPADKREALIGILRDDPRPGYLRDGDREYAFTYAGHTVAFRVEDGRVVLTRVEPENGGETRPTGGEE